MSLIVKNSPNRNSVPFYSIKTGCGFQHLNVKYIKVRDTQFNLFGLRLMDAMLFPFVGDTQVFSEEFDLEVRNE